jgi:hypothetical protein
MGQPDHKSRQRNDGAFEIEIRIFDQFSNTSRRRFANKSSGFTSESWAKRWSMEQQRRTSRARLLNALDHPLNGEIETVRGLILAPACREREVGNAPSYRTTDLLITPARR